MRPTAGPLGRLGAWTASHVRVVVLAWVAIAVGLGIFAPRAEHALSGAGWEASGSESVAARAEIDESFGGQGAYALMVVVHGEGDLSPTIERVGQILDEDPRVAVGLGAATLEERADGDRPGWRRGEPDGDGSSSR